jgi:hypothetical protein
MVVVIVGIDSQKPHVNGFIDIYMIYKIISNYFIF